MYATDHHVAMKNCSFTDNLASYDGGGVYLYTSVTTATSNSMENCAFSNNAASENGGGVYVRLGTTYSKLAISDCVMSYNTAVYYGAGVFIKSGNVDIARSNIHDNSASSGTFTISSGTCTVSAGCLYSPNYPSSYSANGYCSAASTLAGTLSVDIFGLFNTVDTLKVSGTTYYGIHSPDEVVFSSGASFVFSSVVSSPGGEGFEVCYAKAGSGGGVYVANGEVTISQTSITNNYVTRHGGGLFVSSGDVTATNNDISGNSDDTDVGVEIYYGGGALAVSDLQISDYASTSIEGTLFCTSSCLIGQYGNCTVLDSSSQLSACYVNCACSNCSAGTFSSSDGSTTPGDCEACPTGYYSNEGSSECTSCPLGRFATDNVSDTGGGLIHQVSSGATICNACPVGYFASSKSTIVCQVILSSFFSFFHLNRHPSTNQTTSKWSESSFFLTCSFGVAYIHISIFNIGMCSWQDKRSRLVFMHRLQHRLLQLGRR
jgi:hypothetical protein